MDKFKRGQAAYGFRWLGGRLMVEELEAAIRRRAVEEFLKLKSMGAVARHLNDAGFETRRGGKWTDVQIARILECSSAIGTYEINRSEEDGSGQRRKTGKGDREAVECEPIVTREVWDKVQALIQGKRAKRTEGEDEKAPLSGLVWCGCGQKMRMAEGADKFVCPKCSTQISDFGRGSGGNFRGRFRGSRGEPSSAFGGAGGTIRTTGVDEADGRGPKRTDRRCGAARRCGTNVYGEIDFEGAV